MNNSILKMFVPQLLKQADNPELKAKIVQLINDKKAKTLEDFIANEESFEDCQDEAREDLDCVLVISTTQSELIVRVMMQNKRTGEMVGNSGIYRYDDILEAIKKALK